MDASYKFLAERIRQKWLEKQQSSPRGDNARLLITLAGPPGSGKTTIAKRVVEHVLSLPSAPSIVAISADGFHLPLATLRSLPNAVEALARRGAPWTFDGAAAVALVHKLRTSHDAVICPTFDHSVKDPVQGGLIVEPEIQVCLLEGNYLLSDERPWQDISGLVDDRWLVRVECELARKRVALRHLQAGIEDSLDQAYRRADENDMVNGEYVARHSEGRYDVLVESIEEGC
ncbi:Fc.00g033260.m01.CDS01 [Cosmosporella sp. VM-42]